MKRILVIGGYGGFGVRLSRRLANAGHHVLVAGRSQDKAARFAATLANAEPVVVDRNGDLSGVAACRPDLVIDAAGPFQGSDYRVPEACIAAGISYLDLADARQVVTGIGALDGAAKAAGVAVVAGASSAPALTGAVARRLAGGLDRVDRVEIALSVTARAAAGVSVAKAGLSYLGQPVRLWRGRRWTQGYGWQELRRERMRAGNARLGRRLAGLVDVPDLELLPGLLPGCPAVSFRAGNDLSFQMLFLWLASWPVRWGWLRASARVEAVLLALQRLTSWAGGERSGMRIVLTGRRGPEAIERQWTVIAEQDDGAEIPTLAAAMLADRALPPGAYDASRLLTLADYEEAFGGLAVSHEVTERRLPPPLYARIMGAGFDALPPPVRAIHDIQGDSGAAGEGTVARGRNPLARLLGAILRFPPAGAYPLHVAFAERGGRERWTRDFGGHVFASTLSERRGFLVERFGPVRFHFTLAPTADGLVMQLRRWSVFGLPLPLVLAPRIAAREWEADGRFRFDVSAAMPIAGEVVHYQGWLKPVE